MAEEKLPMAKLKRAAEVCSFVDEENAKLNVEVSLPGVKKSDIHLKMLDDSFNLSAPRDDIEFVTALAFCFSGLVYCIVCPLEVSVTFSGAVQLPAMSRSSFTQSGAVILVWL